MRTEALARTDCFGEFNQNPPGQENLGRLGEYQTVASLSRCLYIQHFLKKGI